MQANKVYLTTLYRHNAKVLGKEERKEFLEALKHEAHWCINPKGILWNEKSITVAILWGNSQKGVVYWAKFNAILNLRHAFFQQQKENQK